MRRECRERFPHHRLQRKPLVSDPDMHHGTCVTHVPWCMSVSLNRDSGGKRSRHSRRMRNQQFYVSGKRPMYVFIRYLLRMVSCHVFDICLQAFFHAWRRIYLKVDSHALCTQWYITKRHVCNIKLERVETASMGCGNTKYIVSQRLFESKLIWKNMRKIYKNTNEQKKIPLHRT